MSEAISQIMDVLMQPRRSIGVVLPDCVVLESHMDEVVVTNHPVEIGAPISDHAYRQPAGVVIKAGWSPSRPAIGGVLGSVIPVSAGLVSLAGSLFGGSGDYLGDVYEKLRALQLSGEPFDIVTGKRKYSNMMMMALAVETDAKSEYMLGATITCREVILVKTTTTRMPPAAQQANPASTAAPAQRGAVQPTAASQPPMPQGLP